MRTVVTTALIIVLAAISVSALAQSKYSYTTKTEHIAVSANTISLTAGNDVIIQGNAYVKSTNKTTKAVMEARGSKVVLKFTPSKTKTAGINFESLKSAEISGPVTLTHTMTQPTGTSKTTATAEKATYYGSEMTASLMGKVKIVQEDPTYAKPAVMTGETATVNLDPGAGVDDEMVKVDTPGGFSVVEASPSEAEYIYVKAATISSTRGSSVLQGDAYFKSINNLTNTTIETMGPKVVLKFAPVDLKAANVQFSSVQSAEISGPVTLIHTTTLPDGTNKTTATADKATYSGADQIAHLTGSVKILQENPAFAEPAVITGETAMVNLNPDVSPDEITVQVDTPGGVSRIEVTPKPKEEKKTN